MMDYRQTQFSPGFPGGGFPGGGNTDRRLDRLERQMDRVERQIDQLNRRVDRIERRLGIGQGPGRDFY
ncbi:hypothetical protein [Niallia sp. Krafla_26]|uniref:hypothetical protein n=1 Tax=Niallia sp. Krafla_26 TaxID=3064703 RepID=UPI003D170B40